VTTINVPLPIEIEGVPRPPLATVLYAGHEFTVCRRCTRRLAWRLARRLAREKPAA